MKKYKIKMTLTFSKQSSRLLKKEQMKKMSDSQPCAKNHAQLVVNNTLSSTQNHAHASPTENLDEAMPATKCPHKTPQGTKTLGEAVPPQENSDSVSPVTHTLDAAYPAMD